MQIAQAIDQILIAVLGGSLNADSNVQRQEVKTLLGVVIAFYKKVSEDEKEIKFIRRTRLAMSSINNFSLNAYSDYDFAVTYRLVPEMDIERGEHFVELPVSVDNVLGRIGIKAIETLSGNQYHVAGSRGEMQGLREILTTYAYYEKNGDTKEERVYIVGLGVPVETLLLRLIPEFSDVAEDQSIPLAEGYIKMVIDDCVKFFREQRFITADNFVDSIDKSNEQVHNNRPTGS